MIWISADSLCELSTRGLLCALGRLSLVDGGDSLLIVAAVFCGGVSFLQRDGGVGSEQAHDMEEHMVDWLVKGGFGVVGEDVAQVHRPAIHESGFQVAHIRDGHRRKASAARVGTERFDELPQ